MKQASKQARRGNGNPVICIPKDGRGGAFLIRITTMMDTHTTRTRTHKTDAAANNGGDGGTQDKYRRELDSHWNQSFSSLEEQQKIKMISKLIIILFCFKMIFSPLSLFYSLFLMCFVVVDVCVCNLLFLVLSSSPTFLLEDRFAHELDNVFVLDFLVGLDLWQREG